MNSEGEQDILSQTDDVARCLHLSGPGLPSPYRHAVLNVGTVQQQVTAPSGPRAGNARTGSGGKMRFGTITSRSRWAQFLRYLVKLAGNGILAPLLKSECVGDVFLGLAFTCETPHFLLLRR
jgi:hypothetical protein